MKKQSTNRAPQKARRKRVHRKAPCMRLVKFPQARGRMVERVGLSLDPEFHCVCIRFKDNTDLTVVIGMGLSFQAQYSEWKDGNQQVVKRWPVVHS